ncbi:MAG: Smr/MutS family protein [Rickettsiales bacterium]|nr:Smr/MutS family protein [Rickettsiales bacterium]
MANSDDIWQQYIDGKLKIDDKISKYEEENIDYANILELDLHNFHEEAAFKAIDLAIKKANDLKIKKIKIITGLNVKNKKPNGVLYKQVPRWLEYSILNKSIKNYKIADSNEAEIFVMLK